MSLTRYDGTRILTEADVDREFIGKTVFLDCRGFPRGDRGYLIASVDADREQVELLDEIKYGEYAGHGLIITGSKAKGEMVLGANVLNNWDFATSRTDNVIRFTERIPPDAPNRKHPYQNYFTGGEYVAVQDEVPDTLLTNLT